MKKIYKITYFSGYVGTDETYFIKADCLTKVEQYADDYLPEYSSSWESLVDWSSEDMDEEEYEDYIEGCGYTIEEATEEDFNNWRINPNEILDIS